MDENRNGDNNNKSPQNRRVLLACLVVTGIMVLFFSYFTKSMSKDSVQEIKYNEFLSMLANDKIGEVLIKSDRIVVKPKTTSSAYGREVIYYTGIMDDPYVKAFRDLLCDLLRVKKVKDQLRGRACLRENIVFIRKAVVADMMVDAERRFRTFKVSGV